MNKSISKIPFVDYKLMKELIKNKPNIKTRSRSSIILNSFIGSTIYVYNGMNYKKIIINENMVGHKLGEFIFKRKIGKIHIKKKKKRK